MFKLNYELRFSFDYSLIFHFVFFRLLALVSGVVLCTSCLNAGSYDNLVEGIDEENISGDLDVTFGEDGKVVTEISVGRDVGTSVAVQADGKIVVSGFSNNAGDLYNFATTRYNIDGTLDTDFGENGVVITKIGILNSQAYTVLVQLDGKIIVVGTSNTIETTKDVALVRYLTDGSLDPSFGIGGVVTSNINFSGDNVTSAALQRDGKIVVAANFTNGINNDIEVIRYNNDGSLDIGFGLNGVSKYSIGASDDEAYGIAVQSDGKIVIAASSRNFENYYDIAVSRLNSDGIIDSSFGVDGSTTVTVTRRIGRMLDRDDHSAAIALQTDGKILIAGYSYKDFVIIRFTNLGKLDLSFKGNGVLTTSVSPAKDEARGILVQPDGKIVVVGKAVGSLGEDMSLGSSAMDIAVVRINSNGTLDSTFGIGGHVTTPIGTNYDVAHSAALQPDGKLVVAGYSKWANYNFAVLRYNLGDWDLTPSSIIFVDETGIITDDLETNGKIKIIGGTNNVTYPIIMSFYDSQDITHSYESQFGYIGNMTTLDTIKNNHFNINTAITADITIGGIHATNNASLILGEVISYKYIFVTLEITPL